MQYHPKEKNSNPPVVASLKNFENDVIDYFFDKILSLLPQKFVNVPKWCNTQKEIW